MKIKQSLPYSFYTLILFTVVAGFTTINQNTNVKKLSYEGITFTAPNTLSSPYHVIAEKDGKVIWQINNSAKAVELTEQQKQDLKDGGIEKLVVQNVTDKDLDSGAANYKQMKKYIGKPALYIYYSKNASINKLSSWFIVDIQTGEKINFVAFN